MQRLTLKQLIVLLTVTLIFTTAVAANIPKDTVVAEYKDGKITMGDVDLKISKIPAMYQTRYNTQDGKQSLLDIMCTEEVFFKEAILIEMDKDEDVLKSTIEQQKTNYVREFKKDLTAKFTIPEEAKKQYFIDNHDKFKDRTFEEAEVEITRMIQPEKQKAYFEDYKNDLMEKYGVVLNKALIDTMNLEDLDANDHIEDEILIASSKSQVQQTAGEFVEYIKTIPEPYRANILKPVELKKSLDQRAETEIYYLAAIEQGYEDNEALKELNEQLKRTVTLRALYNKLVVEAVVLEDSFLKGFYDEDIDKYTTKASRAIQLFAFETEKQAKTMRKQVKKLLKQKDEDGLNTLIKENSIRPERNGVIDNIYKNDIVPGIGKDPEFNAKIWEAKPNKLSKISKNSKDEFVFFQITEDRPVTVKPFEEVKESIKSMKIKGAQKEKFEAVTAELESKYELKKYPERMIQVLTSEEYFTKAEESQKKRRFNDAIFYYDQIIKYHQNNTDDYKALFMKAFLYSEELKQDDKAIEFFNQLLAQFPEGDLNESASFMIKEINGETNSFEQFEEAGNEEVKNKENQ
jgi:tetratricopeptide (TPR) repeat protein